MKHFICLILLFCIIFFAKINLVFATPNHKIDSLEYLLAKYPQQDTVRLRRLAHLAEAYKIQRKTLNLLEISNEMLRIALMLQDKIGLIDANLYLGDVIYYSNGSLLENELDIKDQEKYTHTAYNMSVAINDSLRIANALIQMYGLNEDLKYWYQAISLAALGGKKCGHKLPVLYSIRIIHEISGTNYNSDTVAYYLHKFQAISNQYTDYRSKPSLYLLLARHYIFNLEDEKQGFSYLDSVWNMIRADDYVLKCKYKTILGNYCEKKKDFDKAIAHYESALLYADSMGVQSNMITAYENLCKLYQNIGNSEKANFYEHKSYGLQKAYILDIRKRFLRNIIFEKKFAEQSIENTNLIKQQQRHELAFIAVALFFIILAFLFAVYYYNYQKFKRLTKLLRKLNQEIKLKNVEINRNVLVLEDKVQERTRTIQQQNEQLIEIAYYNSHQVRGPLARIMGLLYLYNEKIETNKEKILQLIQVSSEELDKHIEEINNKLMNNGNDKS